MTLIERLKAAEAGSDTLDELVCMGTTHPYGFDFGDDVPPVTTSLDAALALAERVLPGCSWDAGRVADGYYARVRSRGTTVPFGPDIVYAPTPTLAMCIAILKAKEAEK